MQNNQKTAIIMDHFEDLIWQLLINQNVDHITINAIVLIMSYMYNTQVSFHNSDKKFTSTRRSFDAIPNRLSLTARSNSSLTDYINISHNEINRPEGPQMKRFHAQEQLKRRYQKMIELQHRNFIQRHQLQSEREQLLKKQQQKVQQKTNNIRHQKLQLGHSMREWHFRNRVQGAEQRQQKDINHRIRMEREHSQLEMKKKSVSQRQGSFRMRNRQRKGYAGVGEKVERIQWPQF